MRVFKSVGTVAIFTLLARLFGYARDMMISNYIGANVISDLFIAAFRIPNFLRRIFAEGAFSSSFIPLFSGKLEKETKESAYNFAGECHSVLALILSAIAILAMIFMKPIIEFTTPGFIPGTDEFDMAVNLTRITFPYIICISLVALYGGILNSVGKFVAFATVPILLNISLMISLYFLKDTLATGAHALSIGVLIAGFVQMAWMIFFLKRAGIRIPLKIPRLTADVKKLLIMMTPAAIGASVAQINLLVDTKFASEVGEGTMSFLYYADRISQLPLSVIGIAIGTVLLPALSRLIQADKREEAASTLNRSIEIAMLLTLPAAAALMVAAETIVQIIYEHGKFTIESTIATAHTVMVFGAALPAFVLVKVLTPVYFANHDTKTPIKIAMGCIVINLIINYALYKQYHHVGIAIATATSSWINAIMLAVILIKTELMKTDSLMVRRIIGMTTATIVMAIVIIILQNTIFEDITRSKLNAIFALLCYMFLSMTAYIIILFVTKAADYNTIKSYITNARNRKKEARNV